MDELPYKGTQPSQQESLPTNTMEAATPAIYSNIPEKKVRVIYTLPSCDLIRTTFQTKLYEVGERFGYQPECVARLHELFGEGRSG